MSNCREQTCVDTCNNYDLCQVTITGGSCVPSNGENKIVCEGFKFSTKVNSEILTDCSCHEGYGYKVGDITYEWEITNPCDYDWFDKRIIGQVCDKYSMQITGYVQTDCGEWVAKETLTSCFIDETDRDYGKGVKRSLKGKALHRSLGKTDDDGYVTDMSKRYANKVAKGIQQEDYYSYIPSVGSPFTGPTTDYRYLGGGTVPFIDGDTIIRGGSSVLGAGIGAVAGGVEGAKRGWDSDWIGNGVRAIGQEYNYLARQANNYISNWL